MAELGAVKCDFCGFTAEMIRGSAMNLKVPEYWLRIGYNVAVSSGAPKDRKSADSIRHSKKAKEMKDKIRQNLPIMHACPQCASEKVAVDLSRALPGKAKTPFGEEREVR